MSKNYKKMVQDIDNIVNNDWGFEMIDMKHDTRDLKHLDRYFPFTQKEAQEMSEALGIIYSISHGISCVCGKKYEKSLAECGKDINEESK